MFVQIIEGRASDPEGLKRQGERWQRDLRPGATGFLGVTAGTTADGRAITVARFETEAAARANSERAEQSAWWSETEKYYEGEIAFTESSDVDVLRDCERNDAGFVQVMKTAGVSRERMAPFDAAFDQLAALRPDILGGIRAWSGPDRCVEVAYFASEEEARAGERRELPDDLQGVMADFAEVMKDTEYLDLTDPQLY